MKEAASKAYSSIQKIGAVCSSEMSADFQRTSWRYIPEDRTLQKASYCRPLRYNAVKSDMCTPAFWKKKKHATTIFRIHGGSLFLQNAGIHLPDYMVSQLKTPQYKISPTCKHKTYLNQEKK
jgi:hypothetical protein